MNESFSFVDDSFDPIISSSYYLSIQLSLDGFSFCILDPVHNKYLQFQHLLLEANRPINEQVENWFRQIEKLNLPYKKTLVLLPSSRGTLVPTPVFDAAQPEDWMRFCGPLSEKQTVHYNKIAMADAYNVFPVEAELEKLLKKQFPNPRIFHQNTPVIEGNLATKMNEGNKTTLFINLHSACFDLLAFSDNSLKLCNNFPIKSENDFIYFTLFAFEQLKLSPNEVEIIMSGHHPRFDALGKQLSRYLRHVAPSTLPHHFRYSHLFRSLNAPRFYNLLSLPVCV